MAFPLLRHLWLDFREDFARDVRFFSALHYPKDAWVVFKSKSTNLETKVSAFRELLDAINSNRDSELPIDSLEL